MLLQLHITDLVALFLVSFKSMIYFVPSSRRLTKVDYRKLFELGLNLTLFLFQIYVSKKWGFTKYEPEEFERLREENRLAYDGCNVKYRPEHGPLDAWRKVTTELYNV